MVITVPTTHESSRTAFLTRALRICNLFMSICLTYAAVASLANGYKLARQPYQLDYEEGNILNAGFRINAGLTPYPPAGSWPVVLNPYGPIPYHLTAALIRLDGLNFLYPRLAVMLAAILVAIAICLLAGHFTGDWLLSVGFGALFLILPLVQEWTPILRVDLIGLAFALFGWYLFLVLKKTRIAVVILLAAALLCKVTFLAAPLACAFVLIREKRWRELVVGVLAGGAVLSLAAAAWQWTTHGAFLFHQFKTHADTLSWHNYKRLIVPVLAESASLIALTVCGLFRQQRFTPPLVYLLAAAIGTATLLKSGSNSNHLLELEAALCITGAAGLHAVQQMRKLPWATACLSAVIALVLSIGGLKYRALYSLGDIEAQCPQAYALIRDHQIILSENVGALLLSGKPVLLSNPFVYAQLVRSGHWPNGRVEEMLQNGTADLVIIGKPNIMQDRWSKAALAALASNYHPTHQFVCPDAVIAYERR